MGVSTRPIDRRHIDHVVATEGQWAGICDDEGWPIFELPPIISMTAPEARLVTSSCEVTTALSPQAALFDDLIADGFSQDDEGRLIPASEAARFLVICRPGERLCYSITFCTFPAVSSGNTLTIHGTDLIDGLNWWPCPSIPIEWMNAEFTQWLTDASGVSYSTARQLAPVEFGTAADGYTVKGTARDSIRTLIQDSLDAVNTLHGWDDPHMTVDFTDTPDTSDEVLIRTNDDSILDTIATPAALAGISIQVDLWWPGDPPLHIRTSRDPERVDVVSPQVPIQVVKVEA